MKSTNSNHLESTVTKPTQHRAFGTLKLLRSLKLVGQMALLAAIAMTWQAIAARSASAQAASPPNATAAPAKANEEATADASTETEKLYVQIERNDDNEPTALQTAIVRYEGKPNTPFAGKIVDLVGVVHIGQAEYYAELGDLLDTYDKVLYELVAPDGTRIKPEDLEQRRSILASVQTGMKDMLNLEYQLEKIDYMAENFRHADMSPEEFSEDLKNRGDSVWKMVARMMGAGIATQSKNGGDVGLLMAIFSDDRSKMMKRAMASQLVDIEMVSAGMDDADGENTLIKGRNRKAFEVLRDELQTETKTVAVFYGAGHLPDMADRLEENFDMERKSTKWLDAWDLTRN